MTEARPGFNHNDFYHPWLLRQVPAGCDRALDVGCGAGRLARRLTAYARSVDAIDRSAEMIAQARASGGGVHYVEADLSGHEPAGYDFVSCVASLHHMPFAETVTKLRAALTPGGVLAVVGLYRMATVTDLALSLTAIPAHHVRNTGIVAWSRISGRVLGTHNTAPIMDPDMTFPQIKRSAARLLPGAAVRRRLYWRYTLVYRRP
jgi:2-polyprenyl-3-methyl-5-hydroxy-6-metoxy-1,4-benzoquinol methylase